MVGFAASPVPEPMPQEQPAPRASLAELARKGRVRRETIRLATEAMGLDQPPAARTRTSSASGEPDARASVDGGGAEGTAAPKETKSRAAQGSRTTGACNQQVVANEDGASAASAGAASAQNPPLGGRGTSTGAGKAPSAGPIGGTEQAAPEAWCVVGPDRAPRNGGRSPLHPSAGASKGVEQNFGGRALDFGAAHQPESSRTGKQPASSEEGSKSRAIGGSPSKGGASGSLPTGALTERLLASGGRLADLAVPLQMLDIVEMEDVSMYGLQELSESLLEVKYILSKTMFKRLRNFIGESAKHALSEDEERRAPKTSSRKEMADMSKAMSKKPSGVLGKARFEFETSEVMKPTDKPMPKPVSKAEGTWDWSDEEETRHESVELPLWVKWPRLGPLLSLLSQTELGGIASLLLSLLKMNNIEVISEDDTELIAEQVEFNVLTDLCESYAPADFQPKEDGVRGVRAHVRELVSKRASMLKAKAADEAKAAEAKARADAADRARRLQWEVEGAPRGANSKPRTLEYQRGQERIKAVAHDETAREMLEKLRDAIGVGNGESAFLELKGECEVGCAPLANLLHHQDIPQPAGASSVPPGLGSLAACVGHVGDVEAWTAVAAIDVQNYFFKSVARVKLNKSAMDAIDNERLARAAYFGQLTGTGTATGAFKLSEITNPSDPSTIVSGKAKQNVEEARKLLDRIWPVAAAIAAGQPRDRAVHDTFADVHRKCLPEDGSSKVSPDLVDAVYGSFLRKYAEMWSHFQTASVSMPTCAKAWQAAQETATVRDAWQHDMQREITELRGKLGERDTELRTLKTLVQAVEARMKRVEQKPSPRSDPSPTQTPAAPHSKDDLIKLKGDAHHSEVRSKQARAAADKAKADGAADADALETTAVAKAKEAEAAKTALATAKGANLAQTQTK